MSQIPFFQYVGHGAHQSVEWIDGALDVLPALTPAQRDAQERLLVLLGEYVEENEMGMVIPGPFTVRMPEEMRRGREPDLLYLPNEYAEAIQDNYVNSHGVGLVVEIANAASQHRDHVEKFDDYQQAGIPEYWIIDVDQQAATFYVLHNDNHYQPVEPDENGVYHSTAVKDFAFPVNVLWSA
jgi:Uma2 family endonuclease